MRDGRARMAIPEALVKQDVSERLRPVHTICWQYGSRHRPIPASSRTVDQSRPRWNGGALALDGPTFKERDVEIWFDLSLGTPGPWP